MLQFLLAHNAVLNVLGLAALVWGIWGFAKNI